MKNSFALDYSLYLVADLADLTVSSFLQKVESAIAGGVTCVQLRAKNSPKQQLVAVGKQLVNIPSYLVRVASEPHVQHSLPSCIKTGRPGRVAKRKLKAGGKKKEEE